MIISAAVTISKNRHSRCTKAVPPRMFELRSHGDGSADLLVDDVETVLVAEEPPDDSEVLDEDVEGDGGERAANAHEEAQQAEAIEREGLDDSEDVHVDVDGADEGAREVHKRRARDGAEGGQHHVRRGQRQSDPRVARHGQQQLVLQRDSPGVHHQQDALDPAFALLHEVAQGERRLLPHLALHEVEREALLVGAHGKVTVFGHRPVGSVVERHLPLGSQLENEKNK